MTYEELAKACGVHKSTVSRALRNEPGIQTETRERIRKKARELGFFHNPLVSAWMSHVRHRGVKDLYPTIAWLNFENEEDFWRKESFINRFLKGARHHLELNQCRLDEFWVHEKNMTLKRLMEILNHRGIFGLLLPHNQIESFPLASTSVFEKFKCVTVDKRIGSLPHVGANIYLNFDLALKKTRDLGYRRIGFCAYSDHEANTRFRCSSRFLSYNMAIPTKERVPYLGVSAFPRYFRPAFSKWFSKYRPEVIICQNPQIQQILKEEGIRVPEDVGIVHTNLNEYVAGATGIKQEHEKIGAKAASILLGLISQNPTYEEVNTQAYVAGTWVDGNSTRHISR